MESERDEKAGTTKVEEKVDTDILIGTIIFTHEELANSHNPYTLINERIEELRHKIAMCLKN